MQNWQEKEARKKKKGRQASRPQNDPPPPVPQNVGSGGSTVHAVCFDRKRNPIFSYVDDFGIFGGRLLSLPLGTGEVRDTYGGVKAEFLRLELCVLA